VGIQLVFFRGSTLKKLQLDRSEIAGGSGKVLATCSVCSTCGGSRGRGLGWTWSWRCMPQVWSCVEKE